MARHADDAHVVGKVLATELRAHTNLAGNLVHLRLHLKVPVDVPLGAALRGEVIIVAHGRVLDGLEVSLGAGAADDDGEVVRRAGGGANGGNLLGEELAEGLRVEDSLRLLEEEGLVGRPAALRDKGELVGLALVGVEVNLGGEVRAGVLLVEHGEGGHLAVAEVGARVGVVHTTGDGGLVALGADGEDLLALDTRDDGRSSVLAAGEDAAGGDVGVLKQLEGDEAVIVASLLIVKDLAELREVAGAVKVLNVLEGLLGELGDALHINLEHLGKAVAGLDNLDEVLRDEAVLGGVLHLGEEGGEDEGGDLSGRAEDGAAEHFFVLR